VSPTDPIDRLMEEPAAPWKGKPLNWLLFIQVRIFPRGVGFRNQTQIQGMSTLPRYRRDANRTHGLPWAFKRLPLFSGDAPRGSDRLGRVHQPPARRSR
jgi:hypothetical protein